MENVQDRISIAVCVITYGRPAGLIRLLDSLEKQLFIKCAEPEWKIVIVDNDSSAPNRDYIENLALSFPTGITYGVEPERGIASARNTSVKLAGVVDYIAFVDDDEVAEENWLDELLSVVHKYKVDVVCGPVLPLFEVTPQPWIVKGRFFERKRHETGTEIDFGRTGNTLISKRWFSQTDKPFDERLSFIGGSDSLFFENVLKNGAKIVWADDAIVYEYNSPQRANFKWILKRCLRMGNTIVHVESMAHEPFSKRFLRIIKSSGHIVGGVLLLIPFGIFWGFAGVVKSLCMISRGIGELMAKFNIQFEIYK